ncbi:hypothetical protein LINPERPRIM_LOCUS24646 [Linum perenne]
MILKSDSTSGWFMHGSLEILRSPLRILRLGYSLGRRQGYRDPGGITQKLHHFLQSRIEVDSVYKVTNFGLPPPLEELSNKYLLSLLGLDSDYPVRASATNTPSLPLRFFPVHSVQRSQRPKLLMSR